MRRFSKFTVLFTVLLTLIVFARGSFSGVFIAPQTLWGIIGQWVTPQIFNSGTIKPSVIYDATACTSNGCPGTGTACLWDGAHDVQPCIQAAVDAAVVAGPDAEVELPAGVVSLNSEVVPSGQVTIKGRGPGTIWRAMPGNATNPMLLGLTAAASGSVIQDLTFDGDASGGSTGTPAVFIGGTSGSSTTLTATATSSTTTPIAAGMFLYCTGCTIPVQISGGTYPTFTMVPAVTIAPGTQITGVNAGMAGSISGNALTLFGTISGAPLQAGQTVYWNGGSAILAAGSGLNWTFTTSPGTVSFRPMYAAPGAGVVPLVTLFHTSKVRFNNVGWQHSAGIGLNGAAVNDTVVLAPFVDDIGNRYKVTGTSGDRQSALSFSNGDYVSWGFNNKITNGKLSDVGLDAINTGNQTKLVAANNTFELSGPTERAVISLPDYPSAIYPNGCVGCTITGNTSNFAPGQGIDAPGIQKSAITGNVLRNGGGAGIGLFQGTDAVSFTGAMSTTTLTVSAIASGVFTAGQAIGSIGATAIADSTYITVIGTCGGVSPTLPCTATVNNSQTVSSEAMFAGTNVRDVAVTGNIAIANGQWSGSQWNGGIVIGNGVPDTVDLTGNTASDDQVTQTQTYGVALRTATAGGSWTVRPVNLSVIGNQLNGNLIGALLDVSTATSNVEAFNGGLATVTGSHTYTGTNIFTRAISTPGVQRGNGYTVDLTALVTNGASIGDGSTDASPAFSAVAALTTNATINIPCGTYLLNSTRHFVFNHSIAMVGADRGCVTITFPAAMTITQTVFQYGPSSALRSSVSGVTVDLTNVLQPASSPIGIFYANTHRLDFHDNAVINGSPLAYIYPVILPNQTSGFSIKGNIFSMTAGSVLSGNGCIAVQSSSGTLSTNGDISGNKSTNCAFSVIASQTVVRGNTFNSWGSQGAAIYMPGSALGLTGNLIADNAIVGRTVALTGGDILGCMEVGSLNTVIIGNTMSQCPGDGIDYFGPSISVIGNLVNGSGRTSGGVGSAGIAARWAASAVRASGGIVSGNTTLDDGAGTMTYGFADQPYSTLSTLGCEQATQICDPHIGENNFSGTLGPMATRSTETYNTIFAGLNVQGGASDGSANTQTIASTTPPILNTTLVAGLTINFTPGYSNSGAATLNVQTAIASATTDLLNVATKTTGAIAINKLSGGSLVALAGNEILAGVPTSVTFNGTVWIWSAIPADTGLKSYIVSGLPTCNAAMKGGMGMVTDAAATPVYNATVASGGSVIIPVFCNGTNWTNH